jgi:CBS domain-containing protein
LSVAEGLFEISRKGLGMTAVVDEDDRVLGIYTDGDLRRTLDAHHDLTSTHIGDVMTRNVKTVRGEILAAEAVRLMEAYAITALLVVDDERPPGRCVQRPRPAAVRSDVMESAAGARSAQSSLAVFDIDGVFTDGRLWIGSDGVEYKAFSVRDGVGVKATVGRRHRGGHHFRAAPRAPSTCAWRELGVSACRARL